MNEKQLLELAHELRAKLDEVISDANERQAVAQEMDDAFALPEEDRADRLTELLTARENTRTWMREQEATRVVPLGGRGTAEVGTYYYCPNGDFEFVREYADQPVPNCPHDDEALLRADS